MTDDASSEALRLGATVAVNLGVALLVGTLVTLHALRSSRSRWARQRSALAASVFRASAVWTLCATAALLWAQTALITELPLADAVVSVGTVLLGTHLGHAGIAGAVALSALVAAMLLDRTTLSAPRSVGASAMIVAFFAATRSAAGHAGASDEVLPLVVDCAHLLFTSAWTGAVFVATATGWTQPVPTNAADRDDCARHIEALSTIATGSVAALVLTGAFNTWRGLEGSVGALGSTPYGTLLLWKLGFVLSAVLAGAHNRFVAMPRVIAGTRVSGTPFNAAHAAFERVLRLEAILLFVVLVAAALLSTTDPAAAH